MKLLKNIRAGYWLLWVFCLCSLLAKAEYNHELGVGGGVAFYLGDANPSGLFNRPRMAVGAMYRYNFDTRWAIKLNVDYVEVEGNSADYGNLFPGGVSASFQRGFVDACLTGEFNFFEIGEIGYYKAQYKATPYLSFGVGLTAYNNMYADNTMFQVNIPVGIGGKWKINRRFTLGLEWTIHKLFIDDFDVTDGSNRILNDPYKTGKVAFFDTDWYSTAKLYITVNLFNTRKFCR